MPAARLALLLLPLLLTGCQTLHSLSPARPLATERQQWEHRPDGCTGEQCPLSNIDVQRLPDRPALNAEIEQRLLGLTVEVAGDPLPASLQAYERDFLTKARPGALSYLQAKVLDQHDRLVVIELSSYRSDGQNRGLPGRSYLLYDRQLERSISPDELLLPGMAPEFWEQARLAHQAWLKAGKLDQDAEFVATWPFEPTANLVPLRDRVMLKYEIGRIAPYESGHPELRIPYARLHGILRPEYLPGR